MFCCSELEKFPHFLILVNQINLGQQQQKRYIIIADQKNRPRFDSDFANHEWEFCYVSLIQYCTLEITADSIASFLLKLQGYNEFVTYFFLAVVLMTSTQEENSLGLVILNGTKLHDSKFWDRVGCAYYKQAMPERIYNPIMTMGFSAMFALQLDNTKR